MARYGADTRYHKKSIDDMFEMYPKGSNEFDKLYNRFFKFCFSGVH